jgi:hypothetical protein
VRKKKKTNYTFMDEDKTGEGAFRRPNYTVSQVTFNGDEGRFYYRAKDAVKGEDGKFPKTAITEKGQPLSVVYLKIRRVLSHFKKGGDGYTTNEHTSKKDRVILYGKNEVGIAEELREKYPELRTQQIVYCYLPLKKEIVRLTLKGSSLGSDETAKGILKFYDYFRVFNDDEHSYEFATRLTPVAEQGPKGTYYAIGFTKGDKLNETNLETVKGMIDEVHDRTKAVDTYLQAKMEEARPTLYAPAQQTKVLPQVGPDDGLDTIEYPDDDINPNDIPF